MPGALGPHPLSTWKAKPDGHCFKFEQQRGRLPHKAAVPLRVAGAARGAEFAVLGIVAAFRYLQIRKQHELTPSDIQSFITQTCDCAPSGFLTERVR